MAEITVTKGLLGREDLELQDDATTTFSRSTSTGGSQTLTKISLPTPNTFNVDDFGATGDGSTDDYTAIAACYAVACAAGGTVMFSPGKTYVLSAQAPNSPIITLTGSVTTIAYGATIKVTAIAANRATTRDNEQHYPYVFKSIGVDDISFYGGTFDGNRDDTVDPRHGFYFGVRGSRITVRDMHLKDANVIGGPIGVWAYDKVAAAGEMVYGIDISYNIFERCPRALSLKDGTSDVTICHNQLLNMDIAPKNATTNGSSYPITSPWTSDMTCRGIQFGGYEDNTTAIGVIRNVNISHNNILGCTIAIEVNMNNTDRGYAVGVVVSGNTVWALDGIRVNTWDNAIITNNNITFMLDADVTAYAGVKNGGITAASDVGAPIAIEAVSGSGYLISGNQLDLGADAGPASPLGISVGRGDDDDVASIGSMVVGNRVTGAYRGISIAHGSDFLIADNVLENCTWAARTTVELDTTRHANNTYKGHVFSGNSVRMGAYSTSFNVSLSGEWVISGNTFDSKGIAKPLMEILGLDTSIPLDGTADVGSFIVQGNTFLGVGTRAVDIGSLSTECVIDAVFDGNFFDPDKGTTPGSIVSTVAVNPNNAVAQRIKFGRNQAQDYRSLITLIQTAPTAWLTATDYTADAAVTNGGTTYVCRVAHTSDASTEPGVGGSEATYWADVSTRDWDFGEWTTDSTLLRAFWDFNGNDAVLPLQDETWGLGNRKFQQHNMDGGALTETLTGILPARSIIHGVVVENASAVAGTGGIASYSVGDGTDPDLWGAGIVIASGTKSSPGDFTAFNKTTGSSAGDVVLTADAGTFTSGAVNVVVSYTTMDGDSI